MGSFACLAIFVYELMKMSENDPTMSYGKKSMFELTKVENIETVLNDVKGIDEIKEEIQNIIKMIKFPQEYRTKGAKLHKGILLCGRPGTGKTLLSRAIAKEAGVSFIYCSGSAFDEMFVGMGAKRVREMFQLAKKN